MIKNKQRERDLTIKKECRTVRVKERERVD